MFLNMRNVINIVLLSACVHQSIVCMKKEDKPILQRKNAILSNFPPLLAGMPTAGFMLEFLESGLDADKADEMGRTYLIWAVIENQEENVNVLIKSGCNLDVCDNSGKSALMYTVQNNNKSLVISLINAGANLEKNRKELETFLNLNDLAHLLQLKGLREICVAMITKSWGTYDLMQISNELIKIPTDLYPLIITECRNDAVRTKILQIFATEKPHGFLDYIKAKPVAFIIKYFSKLPEVLQLKLAQYCENEDYFKTYPLYEKIKKAILIINPSLTQGIPIKKAIKRTADNDPQDPKRLCSAFEKLSINVAHNTETRSTLEENPKEEKRPRIEKLPNKKRSRTRKGTPRKALKRNTPQEDKDIVSETPPTSSEIARKYWLFWDRIKNNRKNQ